MAMGACLTDLHASGKISQAMFDKLKPAYDELVAQYEPRFGRAAAESMATVKALDGFELDHMRRKRQALLQAKAQGSWLDDMRLAAGTDANGSPAPLSGVRAAEKLRDMEFDRMGLQRQAHGMIADIIETQHRKLNGQVADRVLASEMLDELHGTDSGNPAARGMAEAWTRTAEWLRSSFNALGGHIAKLDGWALPQRHDWTKISEAGFAPWRDFLLGGGEGGTPLIDRAKMIDYATGEPMSDARLELMLRDMWQALASDGMSRRNGPADHSGKASVANSRADHRVLHFVDGQAWAAYGERFGQGGNPLDAMLAHIRTMTRDIAMMKAMGPNPDATLQFQKFWLKKSGMDYLANDGSKPVPGWFARMMRGTTTAQVDADLRNGQGAVQRLFDEYTGANAHSENPRMSMLFSVLSAQQVAAKLGGAFIKSFPDLGSAATTAAFNGLSRKGVLARYLKLMVPGSAEDAALVRRMGIMREEWTRLTGNDFALTGEEITHQVARQVADSVMQASLLSRHTERVQMAFTMELMNAVTMHRGKDFADLDPDFRRMMEGNGINRREWDMLRETEPRQHKGEDWIMPGDVADESVRQKLFQMISREVAHAVTVSDIDTRAALNSTFQRGTWIGEIGRSAFLFKGFGLTTLSLHSRRMMRMANVSDRVGYGLNLLVSLTLAGAMSQQAYRLVNGQDPEDTTQGGFWGRAMLTGGGFGIFGDLINSAQNRFGGGWAQTLVGPLLGDTSAKVADLLITNPVNAAMGRETTFKRDLLRLGTSETPGLSLWYIKTALNRLLIDHVREWADPEGYRAAYRRSARFLEEQNTAAWAPPGSMTGNGMPLRAPDWGNAIGMPKAPENVARKAKEAAQ